MNRIIAVLVVCLMVHLHFPGAGFATEASPPPEGAITGHAPQIRTTGEEDIPQVEIKKKSSKWLWWVAGIVLLGAGAAVASGSGGDDGGGGSGDTGDVIINW